jgi:2',3'-cyclic-nucleotide 2'-phosphodiesterase (5'-nucleotidase family)
MPPFLEVGGEVAIREYYRIAKEQWKDRVILLDTGDIFNSQHDQKRKRLTLKAYQNFNLDAVHFSSYEFESFIENNELFNDFKIPFITSNIIDLKTGAPLNTSSLLPYKVISKAGKKIAIMGMTNYPSLTNVQKSKVKGLIFSDLIHSFLKVKKELRKKRIDLSILMLKIKTECKGNFNLHPLIDNGENDLRCPKEDPLTQFIDRLPPNSIDAIYLNGKSNSNGFYKGIPIMMLKGQSQYLGLLEVDISQNNGPGKLFRIHSPLKTCHKFMVKVDDCHIEYQNQSIVDERIDIMEKFGFQAIPARFLGHEIQVINK